jgi:hypothetical protein
VYLNRDEMEKEQNAESQRKIKQPFYCRKEAREFISVPELLSLG